MGRPLDSLLRASLGIATFCLAASGERAAAYPQPVDFDGSLMRWDISPSSAPITVEITADRAQDLTLFGSAVADSAELWSQVPGSFFRFTMLPDGEPGQVTIHLQSTLDGSAYSAGYALFDEYDGVKPSHCSIYVVVDSTVSYDGLAKTFLHEMGHCAGLGHTLIPEAIMSYSLDVNGFDLDIDDEAAITRLYPRDGSKPKLPPGCAAGAIPQGRGGVATVMLLLAAVAPALFAAINALRPARTRARINRSRACGR